MRNPERESVAQADAGEPRRRRFSFSLRALFVVLTVLCAPCCWFGLQLQIVRERKAILAMESVKAELLHDDRYSSPGPDPRYAHAGLSRIRRYLGDRPCIELELPPSFDAHWIARAEQAFPEAKLYMHVSEKSGVYAFRDSLFAPESRRQKNVGTVFKTGLR